MKKITAFIIMLLSVLNVWGQTEASNFDIEEAKRTIETLKLKTERIVLYQVANAKDISDQDKIEAKPTLDSTFSLLDTVLTYYEDQDDKWKQDAKNTISEFIDEYSINISDRNGQVSISTPNFLETAEKALEQLQVLDETMTIVQTGNKSENSLGDDQKDGTDEEKTSENDESTLMWIVGVVAGVAFVISVTSIVITCNKRKESQAGATKKTDQKDSKNLPPSYDTINDRIKQLEDKFHRSKSDLNKELDQQHRSIQELQRNINALNERTSSPERTGTGTTPPVKEQPQPKFHLYADADSQSGSKAFYKLKQEKDENKTFVLILEDKDADVAEFTINPDMATSRMASVIENRYTCLPKAFCKTDDIGEHPSKIVPTSPGKAQKVNGRWVVETPMHIKIE